jgi:hypothetical protein
MDLPPDARFESLRKSAKIAWIGIEPPSLGTGELPGGPATIGRIVGARGPSFVDNTMTTGCRPVESYESPLLNRMPFKSLEDA